MVAAVFSVFGTTLLAARIWDTLVALDVSVLAIAWREKPRQDGKYICCR